MYTPYPGGFGYYNYSPPSPSPQEIEKQQMRSSLNRVGGFLIALIATMRYTYTIVAIILMAVGFIPLSALTAEWLGLDNTTYMFVYAVVYVLAMGLPLLFILFKKPFFSPLTPACPVRGSIAFGGIVGGVGVCMAANIITSYLLEFLSQFGIEAPDAPQMMIDTPESYLLNLFVVAVLPGLMEEMLFRGCVLRLLRPYGDLFAVLVTAALFGLMHGNIRQIPFAFIVGLVLGWLYVTTNNIWIPICVHFINNAVAVTMEYLAFRLPESAVGYFNAAIIFTLTGIGLLIGGVTVLKNRAHFRLSPKITVLSVSERLGMLFKAPTFLIAVILFVLVMFVGK